MEGNRYKSRALLVFGAPCSGKTTFSEKFAKKFGLAYYNLDELMEVDKFSRENILAILGLISRTHQTIIIEGGLDTEIQRTEIRNVLRQNGYEPSLVWIQTDVNTIRRRLKARFKSVSAAKDVYDKAVNKMEAPAEVEKPIILSGKHTFDTQMKHVLSGLAELSEAK